MVDATCPYCRTAFAPDDAIVVCSGCAARHHEDCLQENGGCTVFGCSQAPAEEPKISVSNRDLTRHGGQQNGAQQDGGQHEAPAAPPPSFLNLSDPAPLASSTAPLVTPTPPPPRPAGAPPPPPPASWSSGALHTSHAPVITYPTFAGYAPPPPAPPSPYEPRKSRVIFVLLAVLLGAFGGHNFYAGYVKKAVIQLCITIFSCFLGSLISWIWAVVEACIVDRDDDGVAFV